MCGTEVAIMAVGAMISSYAAVQQNKAMAGQYDRQAESVRQRAAVESERLRRKAQKELARQRVRYATSGVQLSGSPTEVQINLAKEGELDARLNSWDGNQKAGQFNLSAYKERAAGTNLLLNSAVKTGQKSAAELLKP